ncbi:glycosyltransferase family 4 protein [Phocicoccus pinnipedialis]|uniref:Putative undecaprenyl-phosphate N-acetylglucosaminyl 1-phosphate transferase n=1 Tax=Phocicoccus pinnipedialis TaxID=110845 RepID=A0A6V7R0B0_9BACL|nr:MraY family glycosyltransferase [Jeotgalicoccus pinnipedialis]MBP1938775.1 UDP-GlcNAc:undecaprenyl-phosphate GlcNAc-1-phosphate transferase [Jeotgalicoccus pinnipedialis]CAD2070759.1 putative undecaprenyl-phosphate N-acetylglucosaminyl 1-phosphate transferase [Jeotgalicoccus pinnipedialis]
MYTLFLLILSAIISFIIAPLFMRLSYRFGFVDYPNHRKQHERPMPFSGGVSILVSFVITVIIAQPVEKEYIPIILGGTLIVILGVIDDKYDLKPSVKFLGQLVVISIPIFFGIIIDTINPFGITMNFGVFAIPFTFLWIAVIINAINLIDGLDGLAAGVSVIALSSIAFIGILQNNIFVMMISVILIGSTLGVLYYNFNPAKLFLGDNGSMLLGYVLGVLSILGFKNVTFFSILFPIIILGVPFIDITFAAVRRYREGVSLTRADRGHLHHKLQYIGFSHRESVILIYFMATLFAVATIILYLSTVTGAVLICILLVLSVVIIVEATDLIGSNKRPILNFLQKIFEKISS